MKQKLTNIKFKLIALWWVLTHRTFYVMSYDNRTGRTLEAYKVVLSEFYVWFQKKHGYMTTTEINLELKEIAGLCDDKLARQMIIDLINKLKENKL